MSTYSEAESESYRWRVKNREFDLREKSLIMGILNITPDSFSDGGRNFSPEAALAHADKLVADGADILDIGAESSRPSRDEVIDAAEEWNRLGPVIVPIRAKYPDVMISVDTYRGETAKKALEAGADIINDIYALRRSPEIAAYCAEHKAGLILMHMQGDPTTMQDNPVYKNIHLEIRNFLRDQMRLAIEAGLAEESIAVDPGFGFGKTVDHNVDILAGMEYFRLLQRPICVGASRKRFLGELSGGLDVNDREEATVAAHVISIIQGATIVRTHNVKAAKQSVAVADAVRKKIE